MPGPESMPAPSSRSSPKRDLQFRGQTIPDDLRGCSILLAHADRMWKAEENNAARLATRANFVLSLISAVIGLKLFALGREAAVMWTQADLWPSILFWGLVLASAIALLYSLLLVLNVRWGKPRAHQTASKLLGLDRRVTNAPWQLEEVEAGWYIFRTTVLAAEDLCVRNGERKQAIDTAQVAFLVGFLTLLGSVGVHSFVVASAPRILPPASEPDRSLQ